MRNCNIHHRKTGIKILIVLSTISALVLYILLNRYNFRSFNQFNDYRKIHHFSLVPREQKKSGHQPPESISNSLQIQVTKALRERSEKKLLLMWYIPWGMRKFDNPKLDPEKCGNCEVITDRAKIDHPATSAVIFHWTDIKIYSMPWKSQRRPDQLYVWYSLESPEVTYFTSGKSLESEDNYHFNVTMSFRRDSNIWDPYWHRCKLHKASINQSKILSQKSKFALALVSDCKMTPGAQMRLDLLKSLAKQDSGIELRGSCFGNRYDGSIGIFKFYLAFENAYHCRDYITEKLYCNAYLNGALPVVWGASREDYEDLSPSNSFIFAEDFDTVEQLLKYMRYLDSNDTAYLEYFRWTKDKQPINVDRERSWCSLCRMVHGINIDDFYQSKYTKTNFSGPYISDRIYHRTVPSLKDWYYGTENPACLKGGS